MIELSDFSLLLCFLSENSLYWVKMSISSALTGIYLGTHTMIEQRAKMKEQRECHIERSEIYSS